MFKRENLRKNFLRVKQNIDQNLGRAEKSEVLSEDQQENEKRVEVVKHVFQNISKKAAAVLQAQGTDNDKRLKKLPEYGLGAALIESAQALGGDTLLGSVCQLCGDCQQSLAKEQLEYETNIEAEFIAPLQNIYDVEIPSIMKFRKALNKSTLDMDSAKTRLNQAMRQSQVPGANMASAGAKVDVIREEYEEASVKVETIKDNLSIELCNFAAKESDQSYRMLLLLQAQANFHRKALEAIEACIPQIKQEIHNSPAKPCYGMPLEEHLRLMCRDIALVLEACILTLLETGMEEEGLFRIAGAAIKLKKLKACFDANTVDMEEFSTDPHTIAGALKQYLRELPEPLLTFALHDDFLKAASLPQDQRLQTLWTLINKLPKANYNNFRYLIKFLSKLAEKSDINKMKPSNIAIVIGPNLLWSEKNNAPNMLTTGTVSAIIEAIVTHADWFFAGAFDFHTTGHGSSPKPCREPGFVHNIKTHNVNSKVVKEKGDAGEDSPKKIEPDKGGNKEESTTEAKIVTVQQSEFPLQKSKAGVVKMSGEEEESSSDETNPFSEKYESKTSLECRVEKEKGDPGESLMSGGRRNGHCVESSSTNTGDYDNIMYTVNPLNPMYRSSTLSRTHPVAGSDTRRGSADNILNLGKQTSPPLPPSRPSRLSKKMSPVQSDHLPGYSCLSRSESQSSCSDTNQSVCSLNPTMHTPHQSKSRFVVGSTPNITSLPGSRMDEETYSGFQGPLWNRPSQKVNFNTLKRGSDPCITSPPPQFVISSSQRPLKISRSQLGTPPKPGEAPRFNSHSQEEVSRSHQAGGSHAGHSHVDKSFHQDTYSTAFALTSLGAGTKSTDYLTRVRAMWDDRHQQQTPKADSPPPPKTTCAIASSDKHGKPDKVFGCLPNTCLLTTSAESAAPSCEASKVQIQPYACADQSDFDFNIIDYREEGQEVQTEKQNNNMEALKIQVSCTPVVNQPPSPGLSTATSNTSSTGSLPVPHDSPEPLSPVQRRGTRKPAPPPPPERPFTVMVTATTALGTNRPEATHPAESDGSVNNGQFQTWPRSAPLASPDSPSEQQQEKSKLPSGHLDRPSMPPPDRPQRPRMPPTLNTSAGRGHQRSASTGTMINQTTVTYDPHAGVPNAGSLSSYSIIEGDQDNATVNQGVGSDTVNSTAHSQGSVAAGLSHTLGRHSSVRPRLTPPPPPPPVARESEDTKL